VDAARPVGGRPVGGRIPPDRGGVAGVLLLQVWGFVTLAGGIACTVVMLRIIDPKLRAISTEFETKEAHYLERLNRVTRWESNDER